MGMVFEGRNFSVDMTGTSPDAQLRMLRSLGYLMTGEPTITNNQGVVSLEGRLAAGVDQLTAHEFYEWGQQPRIPAEETIQTSLL